MQFKKIAVISLLFLWLLPCVNAQDNFWYKLKNLRWIGYAPTGFNPQSNRYPSEDSIRQDLQVLLNAGFTGIVTYGSESSLRHIPRIAKDLGFKGVIMGIWDIRDWKEICSALSAQEHVDGYCVGNEGYKSRYHFYELKETVDFVRSVTGKPTTTTEQLCDYYSDRRLLEISDWVFVNIHPYFHGLREPAQAVVWIKEKVKKLATFVVNEGHAKVVVIKESGFPTNGDYCCNQKSQQEFLNLMEESGLVFIYFEAFDQVWKNHLCIEPHWGLFDCSRRPKQYIRTRIERCWLSRH
jgi:exo-beta-1,3-glucanase (GH17 family)